MGFRRGWLLGLLAGIVAAVISGRPAKPSKDEGAGGHAADGAGSLLDEARAAANAERAATEARLEERFRVARRTGHMPEDPS